jgi:hypothetical protein
MSLWTCPAHGLFGGRIFCPQCGGMGFHVSAAKKPAKPNLKTKAKG